LKNQFFLGDPSLAAELDGSQNLLIAPLFEFLLAIQSEFSTVSSGDTPFLINLFDEYPARACLRIWIAPRRDSSN